MARPVGSNFPHLTPEELQADVGAGPQVNLHACSVLDSGAQSHRTGNGRFEYRRGSVTVGPSGDTGGAGAENPGQISPAVDGPQPTSMVQVEVVLRFVEESVFRILGDRVGPNDRLAQMGVDSLAYAELLIALDECFQVSLAWADACNADTALDLAKIVVAKMTDGYGTQNCTAGNLETISARQLFIFYPSGPMSPSHADLARHVEQTWTTTCIGCPPGYLANTQQTHAQATVCAGLIRAVQPAGPYALGGYGAAHSVAVETARLLTASGGAVHTLLRWGYHDGQ